MSRAARRTLMHRHGITDRFKLIIILTMIAMVIVIQLSGARSSADNKPAPPRTFENPATQTPTQTPGTAPSQDTTSTQTTEAVEKPEGCVGCHGKIEPMHKYGPKGKLDEAQPDGKDALGLTCTACHGGEPAGAPREEGAGRPPLPPEREKKPQPQKNNKLAPQERPEIMR